MNLIFHSSGTILGSMYWLCSPAGCSSKMGVCCCIGHAGGDPATAGHPKISVQERTSASLSHHLSVMARRGFCSVVFA